MIKNRMYKKIGDLCTVVTGTTPSTSNPDFWNGDIKWITPAEISEETIYINDSVRKITQSAVDATALSSFPAGTVILSSRAPIGKVAIAGTELYCNQGFKNLICGQELDNQYLYFFLKSRKNFLNSLGSGATFKEISKKIVEQILIPYVPLPEQRAIVAALKSKLDAIASIEEKTRKQMAELEACLKKYIEENLVEKENEKWEQAHLGELCEIITGTTPSTSIPEYWDGHIDWLTPAEINENTLYVYGTVRKITDRAVKDNSLTQFPAGTVILSTRAPIGKVAIAGKAMYCNQGFKNLVCKEKIYNKYLYWLLKNMNIELNSLGSGSTFKEISKSIVSSISIAFPSYQEQVRIANFIDMKYEVKKSVIAKLSQQLKNLSALRNALYQEAFGGDGE